MSSIERKCHCLKREKTLAMPRHIIFFDVETKPEKLDNGQTRHRFKLGWACYYRKAYGRNLEQLDWFNFDNILDFWQFVDNHTEKKRKLWVLARNIVFDFTVVEGWRNLRRGEFKLKFFHNTGATSIISVRGAKGSIVFLDIMNWFVESLAKTGERIGIPKLKIDFETCTDEYLNIYCKRDVEIEVENFKRFIKFLEVNTISRLCYTQGSTAMAAYLLNHYHKRIWIHNNKEAIDLERAGYRGGRTECFYLGELKNDNYYIVDVNSLYPFVMRNNLYPVKYQKISHKDSPDTLRELLKDSSAVATVLIETDEPAYAVRKERTIFPIGRFWVTLTTPELLYALEHNHILKVGDCVFYEQANIFKSYVDRFYKMRLKFMEAGIDEYVELCKKLLNTLYGKFGQKAEVWRKIGVCPDEPDRIEVLYIVGSHKTSAIRYLLGEVFELEGHDECFNSFPAIAAHVAAYGRLYLWELMKKTGENNYFYCDTDSLIINERGLQNLGDELDNTCLGGLKVIETMESMNIRGLKDYSIGDKEVIKGIRKLAIKIGDGVYEQELWPSFKGLLRRQHPDVYAISTIRKRLTREYTKGRVMSSGLIEPLILDVPSPEFRLL